MDIRTALDALVKVEEGLSITEPSTVRVAKAYKFVPPQSVSIAANLPTWTNDFTLTSYEGNVSQSVTLYTVHAQLFIGDGDQDVNADIAASFMTAFLTAMSAASQLVDANGTPTVTQHTIRGGNPTLAGLTRDRAYIGLDLFIDLHMVQGATFA